MTAAEASRDGGVTGAGASRDACDAVRGRAPSLITGSEPVAAARVEGPSPTGSGPTTAARVEAVLARTAVYFRLAGLVQIAAAATFAGARYPRPWATFALIVLVFAEGGLWAAANLRARRPLPGWGLADAAFIAAAIPVGAALTAPRDAHTWAHFMYPFSLIASVAFGVTFRDVRIVVVLTSAVAATYGVSAVIAHHDPVWNVFPNAVSYYANALVAWAAARVLRASARDADYSRASAVAHADELARERERARHARLLHDRVLQTLETLARSDLLPDAALRAHLGGEAAWLRALVEGAPLGQPDDVLAALQTVIQRKSSTGLHIEFNSTQLRDAVPLRVALPAATVEALADATGEALTNVTKHAGVDTATVRTTVTGRQLVVSILDQGRGFDPAETRKGIGLTHSIVDRMAGVDGTARIDSAPGSGTYVELTVRAPSDG